MSDIDNSGDKARNSPEFSKGQFYKTGSKINRIAHTKSAETYLKDIENAIEKIEKYTKNMSFHNFKENELVTDGVIRNLGIIGEAVKSLPDEFKDKNKEIEWKKIAGFRDVLIHSYARVDLEIVWDVVSNKIEALKRVIGRKLK